jgi:hypothetical protein
MEQLMNQPARIAVASLRQTGYLFAFAFGVVAAVETAHFVYLWLDSRRDIL